MRRRRPPILIAIVTFAASWMFAAGCGSSAPGVPTASNASTAPTAGGPQTKEQVEADAIRFSGCMRSHGVPDFPEAASSPGGFKHSLDPAKAHSPAFASAEAACRYLLPRGSGGSESPAQTQARVAALLSFTRCLRSHGVPKFPDPSAGGELTHEMLAAAGVNVHDAAVLRAADACVGVTHGLLTKAAVASFAAGN
ncbi:MAG TPA: hypothetical protein VHT27_12885 [Solirubrobacteraceae bacterium]|jgi:hypothetical protein|nr:hypothetical protein [Solirubrobacteraceae bacterium]